MPKVPIVAATVLGAIFVIYVLVTRGSGGASPTPTPETATVVAATEVAPPTLTPATAGQTVAPETAQRTPCGGGIYVDPGVACPEPGANAPATEPAPTLVPTATPIATALPTAAPTLTGVVGDGCVATETQYGETVPEGFTVAPGRLLVVSFFRRDQPEQVTVLTEGVWRNESGFLLGVTYEYPACPLERVERNARRHAAERNGQYLGLNAAFLKVDSGPTGEPPAPTEANVARLADGRREEGALDQDVSLGPGDALVGQSYAFSAENVSGGGDNGCQVFGLLGPYEGTVGITDGEWWWFEGMNVSAEVLRSLMAEAESAQRQDPAAGCATAKRVSNVGSPNRDLTATEVAGWCSGACGDHNFRELTESGRTIVEMTTGVAVTIAVPAGVSVDGWGQTVPSPGTGCDVDVDLVGPGDWIGCAAAFRRFE